MVNSQDYNSIILGNVLSHETFTTPRGFVIFQFVKKIILVEFSSPQIDGKKRLKTIVVNTALWRWRWRWRWLCIILVIIYYLELRGGRGSLSATSGQAARSQNYKQVASHLPSKETLGWFDGRRDVRVHWCLLDINLRRF